MKYKRITFTIDEITHTKTRNLQSNLIKNTDDTWSYSKILNLLIKKGLKVSTSKNIGDKK